MQYSFLLVLGTACLVSGQRAQFQPVRVTPGQYGDGYNLTFAISGKDIPNKNRVGMVDPYVKVYYTNKTVP